MQKIFILIIVLSSTYGFSQKKLEVYFDFNQDMPNEASQSKINQWISDNKTAEVTKVLGYCDSVDSNNYNKELAMRRIYSMLAIFKKENIKVAEKVEVKSFGEDFTYSKIQSENRKVEVFYSDSKDEKSESKTINARVETPFGRTPGKPKEVTNTIQTKETKEDEEYILTDLETLVAEEKSGLALKFENAKNGDLIRISNISFYFNSEKVMEKSIPLLEELFQIMANNPKLVIAIHGHICCNPNPNDTKLSYRRALVIFKYLQNNGIPLGRMSYRGYGSNNPIYNLPERNEKQRAANRRVEILIVRNK
jgi:outer membrane protein OmpA-like peptidoglycan-associated protein